jgi:hypothetical protein
MRRGALAVLLCAAALAAPALSAAARSASVAAVVQPAALNALCAAHLAPEVRARVAASLPAPRRRATLRGAAQAAHHHTLDATLSCLVCAPPLPALPYRLPVLDGQACSAAPQCGWCYGACAPLADEEGRSCDEAGADVGRAAAAATGDAARGEAPLLPDSLVAADAAGCDAAASVSACAAAGADCRWCVSHAVPSLCATADEAARLPPSVFACHAPAVAAAAAAAAAVA